MACTPPFFPRQQWYVAGHSHDLGRTLMSRWILGDPICFYRPRDGRPVALVDRCIHRQMPLTMGRLTGDDVECGYHGILFGEDGRARRIPSQNGRCCATTGAARGSPQREDTR